MLPRHNTTRRFTSDRCFRPVSSYFGDTTSGIAESLEMGLNETISFVENTAFGYGGAISLTNPVNVNISNVAFTLNSAESGGAAAITSSVWAPAGVKRCRFESNNATRGGGLHISGEIQTFLEQSSFRRNVAGETLSRGNRMCCDPCYDRVGRF